MSFRFRRRYSKKYYPRSASPVLDAAQVQELAKILAEFQKDAARAVLLTGWEREFLESVRNQSKEGKRLTLAQFNIVKRIDEQRSAAAAQGDAEWAKAFDAAKMDDWNICLLFYRSNGYFSNITRKYTQEVALVDGKYNYVPDRYSFEKLVDNKYAKSFLEQYRSAPKFSVADLVVRPAERAVLMVVKVGTPATHFKGSRLYECVYVTAPTYKSVNISFEERALRLLDAKWAKRLDNNVK